MLKWTKEKVKCLDSFSQPIQLSYKGDTKYSTFMGGVSTIIILMIMLIYSISLLIALVERSETRKSKNTIVNDLSSSPPIYNIDEHNFGLAHLFREQDVPFNDESYVNVRYYQVTQTLVSGNTIYNRTEYDHTYCYDDFPFSDQEYMIKTGLINHAQCPETQSYEIYGTTISEVYKYLEVRVRK